MLTRRKFLSTTAIAAGGLLGCGARSNLGGSAVPWDVCIVGSGFAGTFLGLRLVEHGFRTLMIEAGDAWHPGSSPADASRLFPIESGGDAEFPAEETRAIALGGASALWAGISSRLLPTDFRARSKFGLFADWPVDYDELAPYYCEAEEKLSVRGYRHTAIVESPRDCPFPVEMTSYSGPDDLFRGMRVRFSPIPFSTRNGKPEPIRLADVELPRFASSPGAELRPRCLAVRLHSSSANHVDALETAVASGIREPIQARAFVVAAGPFESARLLLASQSRIHPKGPGNRFGLVGANFNAHPRESTRLDPSVGSRFPRGRHRSYSLADRLRGEGVGAIQLDCRFRRQSAGFNLMLEMEPSERNRLTLDGVSRDPFGRPAVRLNLNWSEIDRRTLARSLELRQTVLESLGGLTPIEEEPKRRWFHPAGTCRMAARESEGVVDRNGRVFGLDNLFVAGTSVFPTSGCTNPTLTVVALSLRLADHLRGTLGKPAAAGGRGAAL